MPGDRAYVGCDEYLTVLTPEQAAGVMTLRAGVDEHGWQRVVSSAKVAEIAYRRVTNPWVRYPAIMLAEIDGQLYDMDGVNRRCGLMLADSNILAHVIVTDHANARRNFALHGTRCTRIPTHTMVIGGDGINGVSTEIMRIARMHGAQECQVRSLMRGLVFACEAGSFNLVDDGATIDAGDIRRAEIVLRVWVRSRHWRGTGHNIRYQRQVGGTAYPSIGTMRMLGVIARDYTNQTRLGGAIMALTAEGLWAEGAPLHDTCDSHAAYVGHQVWYARQVLDSANLGEDIRRPVVRPSNEHLRAFAAETAARRRGILRSAGAAHGQDAGQEDEE